MLNAKQVARLDSLLLDAETTKKQVRDYLTGLLKSNAITEGDGIKLRRILSDADMGAKHALDEIRAIVNIQNDAQKTEEKNPANAESNLDQNSPEADAEKVEDGEPEAPAGPSLMSSLIGQITDPVIAPPAPPAPKAIPEKTGKTIEPNRAEQNGLKRPSAGSTCAVIWSACDRITAEKGSTCTSGELFAACNGLNECTLRTQYARWRQFNGVTGRLPGQVKVAKVPAEFQEVLDNLKARVSNEEAAASLLLVKTSDELVTWLAANFINF